MMDIDKWTLKFMPYIITPMRYFSKDILQVFYHANINDFDFVGGYYRPKVIHPDWLPYMDKVCGEINGEVRCCNCNIEN